ncbi:hypothetical protein [Streptomyces sp. NPDC056190]|uniref:hypothetical protein n=1 Tax=unclassified Streptomyces TaxID=2593676 RepID=UPI0035D776DC
MLTSNPAGPGTTGPGTEESPAGESATDERSRAPAGRHYWALVLLRSAAVLFLLGTLFQAALAGLFVTGDVAFLAWHAANATVLTALVAVQAVAALVVRRSLHGPRWPFPLTLGLLALLVVQQGMGEARMLGGHIPMGLTIFGTGATLAAGAFAFRPRRSPRPTGREGDQ